MALHSSRKTMTKAFRQYAVCFDGPKMGMVIGRNRSNTESIYQEPLETLRKNTFTPIEWQGFTPYNQQTPGVPRNSFPIVQPTLGR
jgi:hypothetical protein